MKLLSIIVPSYNSQDYLDRCIESLLIGDDRIEIIIVNDGSTDATGQIADGYQAAYPELVRVIHQVNKGHGGGINSGLNQASGKYFKVIDSDDWADEYSLKTVMEEIANLEDRQLEVDLLINNYVYERDGKALNRTIHFKNTFPTGEIFSWELATNFPRGKYLMMHALIYNTALLRRIDLALPEKTFYVDNLYVYLPFKHVRTMKYIDVDLYRYYIGREDQSITEANMIQRIDQQLKVNKLMIEATDWMEDTAPASAAYLVRHLEAVISISSSLLNKIGTDEAMEEKLALWNELERINDQVYSRISRTVFAKILRPTSPTVRWTSNRIYRVIRTMTGY